MILETALTGLPGRVYFVRQSFREGGLPSKLCVRFFLRDFGIDSSSNVFLIVM